MRQAVRCCTCSIALWQKVLERGITRRSCIAREALCDLRRQISHRTLTVKD